MANENTPSPPANAPSEDTAAAGRERLARRERAVLDALRTLLRDEHHDRFGPVPPRDPETTLTLRFKVRPGEGWALAFEPALNDQLGVQLEDWQAGRNVYREGRVYCFHCDTAECAHARPSSPLEVFKEYAPNGTPVWHELAQALLDARDARVDRLYGERGGLVALFQPGRAVRGRQLASFGRVSRTYAVLAQVVAGFFPLPGAAEAERKTSGDRLALTFQAVEGRTARGEWLLRLNVISSLDIHVLKEFLAEAGHPVLERAWHTAAQHLGQLEWQVREAVRASKGADAITAVLSRVPTIMQRLADSLERGGRQESRRTRHVEQRRREQRPVHKALEDVRHAEVGRAFADEKAGTWVACGPQCRAHAFNRDGRHVTSFTLRPSAIDFRLRTRRWRLLSPEEVDEFKKRVEQYRPPQNESGPLLC